MSEVVGGLVLILILIGIYFLPTWVARARKSPKVAPVFIINLFLGWTPIGWVAASVLAVWFKPSKSQP